MSINYSFAGKRVLITGGGSGIGRQLVTRFSDGGATVFTIDKNAKSIEKLLEEFPSVTAKVVDLADWDETRKVVESFGTIDHLVNNAGVAVLERFNESTKGAAALHMNVMYYATLNVSQCVTKKMIETNTAGSIVNVCSISTKLAIPYCGTYAAAKAAIESLTRTMSVDLAEYNIRVNAVSPGPVDTAMVNPNCSADDVVQRMIYKRFIKPDEIADTILFLLSPLAAMIVGQSIIIDGGYTVA